MCKCTPEIRTPFCGKLGCQWPDKQTGKRDKIMEDSVLENNFTYHSPKPGQNEKYVALREKAKELAYLIKELTPASREQSVAMTNLETAIFWSNAAISRNE